jgi:predicted DCC family thiol-disulfide oxidoreductase YuxK
MSTSILPENVGREVHAVVLYDGECGLCDRFVQFTLARDPAGRLRYAPLQSEFAAELLRSVGMPPPDLGTMVVIEGGRAYTRSTAALRALARLRFPWPMVSAFRLVPRFLRDPIYRLVASNRYRWFGRADACRLLTPELRQRFLAT